MRKYCRKIKKRRVNFSLLRTIEVGNTEALLSILWVSVVKICVGPEASLISCLAAIYLPNWGAGL